MATESSGYLPKIIADLFNRNYQCSILLRHGLRLIWKPDQNVVYALRLKWDGEVDQKEVGILKREIGKAGYDTSGARPQTYEYDGLAWFGVAMTVTKIAKADKPAGEQPSLW